MSSNAPLSDRLEIALLDELVENQKRIIAEQSRAIAVMHSRLEQIAVVCTDNMGSECDHRMALNFVWQIANDVGSK